METYKKGNQILRIMTDEAPEDPRRWDNLGVMTCAHKTYELGDEQIKWHDFKSWDDIEQSITDKHNVAAILPLFLLDHSGITISVNQFACPWDSGQVGFIYMTNKVMKENKLTKDRAIEALKSEVETYEQYISNDVYAYEIVKIITCKHCEAKKEEMIDSCCGFYGYDHVKSGLYESAQVNIKEWEEIGNGQR